MTISHKVITIIIFLLLFLSCLSSFFIHQNSFRFAIICLCAFIAWKRGNQFAALLTIFCDYFMLFPKSYALGIFLFCLVHVCYICAILKIEFPIGLFLFGLLIPFLPIEIMGMIYAGVFLSHCFFAHRNKKELPNPKLYFWALFCFACCDILVALQLNSTLIWIFYTPSQVLLAFYAHPFSLPKIGIPTSYF